MITVAEVKEPVAMFAIKVVPSDCISSMAIQYLRSPLPDVFCANKLLTHSPGTMTVVSRGAAGVTKLTIAVLPSAGSKLDVVIVV